MEATYRPPADDKVDRMIESPAAGGAGRGSRTGSGLLAPHFIPQVHSSFRDFSAEQGGGGGGGGARGLAVLLKPPVEMIFPGDWDTLREVGTRAGRWLLVNIQVSGARGRLRRASA